MTPNAIASEPTELEARNRALKNCATVILLLASSLEHDVDPVGWSRVTQLVSASRRIAELLAQGAGSTGNDRKPFELGK